MTSRDGIGSPNAGKHDGSDESKRPKSRDIPSDSENNAMSTLIDNSTLMQHIRQMLENGRKGTLFITTDDNHSLTLTFEGGVITGVSSRGLLHGARALRHLSEVNRASYTLDVNVLTLPGGMPDPNDVASILGLQVSGEISESSPGALPAQVSSHYHEEALRVMEEHLGEALGPYAAIVMNELRASLAKRLEGFDDVGVVVRDLAKEIDSDDQARGFIDQTLGELGKLHRSLI